MSQISIIYFSLIMLTSTAINHDFAIDTLITKELRSLETILLGGINNVCKDFSKVVCQRFAVDCFSIGSKSKWMRKHCKKTCSLCREHCFDHKKMKVYCGGFRKNGLCKTDTGVMYYCRKTCGFCT